MIENLPGYVNWVFIATTVLAAVFYLGGVWQVGRDKVFLAVTAVVLSVLLVVHGLLAAQGFYLVKTFPPRFALVPFPSIVILLILFFVLKRGRDISVNALRIFTILSVIRIPVEMVLLWLYEHGQIPQIMTFEGRNYDIISGLTAPLVAWMAFRGGKVNRPLLIGWNLLAFGLLLNIMTSAILSLDTPFQQFGFEQPARGILYFPFIWLPALIVPVVFTSHVVSLWQLLKKSV